MAGRQGREHVSDARAHGVMVVASLARMIAEDELPIVDDMWTVEKGIDLPELRRLAEWCDDRNLHVEAARIRRWLGAL